MNTLNIDGKTYELKEITSPEPETKPEEPHKPKSIWDLKPMDKYCVIVNNNRGDVFETKWEGIPYDIGSRDLGNCFLTREEAYKELAKRKAITKIKKFIHDEGMGSEWINYTENYYIFERVTNGDFQHDYTGSSKVYAPFGYLGSEEHAQKIIDTFPDELKLIYDV